MQLLAEGWRCQQESAGVLSTLGEDDLVPTSRAVATGRSGVSLAGKPLVSFGDT